MLELDVVEPQMRTVHVDFDHCRTYLPVFMATANIEYEAITVRLGGAWG